jgi:hypothetical protein
MRQFQAKGRRPEAVTYAGRAYVQIKTRDRMSRGALQLEAL